MKNRWNYIILGMILLITLISLVKAENSSDGNYTIEEAIFGSGLIVNDSDYEVASVFDLDLVGLSTGEDYQMYSGFYNDFNACIENWSCTGWSDVVNSCGTRTCTDSNSCGTEYYMPSESLTCPSTGGGGGGAVPRGRQIIFHVFNNELQRTQEVIIELTGPTVVFNENDYWVQFTVTVDGTYHTLESNPTFNLVDPYNDLVIIDKRISPIYPGAYKFTYDKSEITLDGIWTSQFEILYQGELLSFEEYWMSRSAPTKLTIENVDNTAPEVECNLVIENEGVYEQEYVYRYWLTKEPGGLFEDAISGGSESKLLTSKESIERLIKFDVTSLGSYWCKADVEYGGKKSAASASFIVTESDTFIPDFTYVKQKTMEVGGTVYPSQPLIGIVIVIVFISILLSIFGIIPDEAKKFIKKKALKFKRTILSGDDDE